MAELKRLELPVLELRDCVKTPELGDSRIFPCSISLQLRQGRLRTFPVPDQSQDTEAKLKTPDLGNPGLSWPELLYARVQALY